MMIEVEIIESKMPIAAAFRAFGAYVGWREPSGETLLEKQTSIAMNKPKGGSAMQATKMDGRATEGNFSTFA